MSFEKYKRETEIVSVEFERFTVNGLPTCMAWFGDNDHKRQCCSFLGTSNFGTVDRCLMTGERLHADYENFETLTTPRKNCPLWKDRK